MKGSELVIPLKGNKNDTVDAVQTQQSPKNDSIWQDLTFSFLMQVQPWMHHSINQDLLTSILNLFRGTLCSPATSVLLFTPFQSVGIFVKISLLKYKPFEDLRSLIWNTKIRL